MSPFLFDIKYGLIRYRLLEISVKSFRKSLKKLLENFTSMFVILSSIISEKTKDSGSFRINRSILRKQT